MVAECPAVIVEIAFNSNPGELPMWTDVSPFVRELSIRRGRQRELDRMEAGTAVIVLDNRDRRFDPTNVEGPYYGKLIPMRRIRVGAVWGDTTYWLFSGFTEAWRVQWGNFADSTVILECSDLFKPLNLFSLDGASFPQEYSGQRVHRVLDLFGWPAEWRDIDIGQSLVQPTSFTTLSRTALAHLFEVTETENGMFFVARDGKVTFRDRNRRLLPGPGPIFGDLPGELSYRDLAVAYTDSQIWNYVIVRRSNGDTPGVAYDGQSRAKYMTRVLKRDGLLQVTDDECQAAAEYLVNRYAEPGLLFVGLTIEPHADPRLWPTTLGRDLGDRVFVRRRPPGGGHMIEQESFVESIDWYVKPNSWKTTWSLSRADVWTFWILPDSDDDPYAPYSKLGVTTRLAY